MRVNATPKHIPEPRSCTTSTVRMLSNRRAGWLMRWKRPHGIRQTEARRWFALRHSEIMDDESLSGPALFADSCSGRLRVLPWLRRTTIREENGHRRDPEINRCIAEAAAFFCGRDRFMLPPYADFDSGRLGSKERRCGRRIARAQTWLGCNGFQWSGNSKTAGDQ